MKTHEGLIALYMEDVKSFGTPSSDGVSLFFALNMRYTIQWRLILRDISGAQISWRSHLERIERFDGHPVSYPHFTWLIPENVAEMFKEYVDRVYIDCVSQNRSSERIVG